jgi:hypothetical protein
MKVYLDDERAMSESFFAPGREQLRTTALHGCSIASVSPKNDLTRRRKEEGYRQRGDQDICDSADHSFACQLFVKWFRS